MLIWLDLQLSPAIAAWMCQTFRVEARPLIDLGKENLSDRDLFHAAAAAHAVIMTKDDDFVNLALTLSSGPTILYIRCGNTSNARLRGLLLQHFPRARELIAAGEKIVEIIDQPPTRASETSA